MSAVVDFEGFQMSNQHFIIKELAFYSINNPHSHGVWYFQSPMPFEELSYAQRKQMSWVTRNIHQINWREGFLSYSKLKSILSYLFESFSYIYVKGLQKRTFLELLTGKKCRALEEFDCPKVEDLLPVRTSCSVHELKFHHCALVKATAYGSYLREYLKTNGSSDCHHFV